MFSGMSACELLQSVVDLRFLFGVVVEDVGYGSSQNDIGVKAAFVAVSRAVARLRWDLLDCAQQGSFGFPS